MAKLTAREFVIDTLYNNPDLSDKDVIAIVKQNGYKEETAWVMSCINHAKASYVQAVRKFRDINPDNNIFSVDDMVNKGKVKIGVISDTHFGCHDVRIEEMEKTIDVMLNEGIKYILGGGDLIDGFNVYRGHAGNLKVNSADGQVQEAIKKLPLLPKGCEYLWISGNHDLVWFKQAIAGDPLITFADSRPDVQYLGKYSAYLKPTPNTVIQIVHPEGSASAPSLTATAYKFVSNTPSYRRPDICIFGHWHCPFSIVHSCGTRMEGCASFQGPGDLSVRHGWPNIVGGKIIEFDINKDGSIGRYKLEDILFGQKSIIGQNAKPLPKRR